MLLLTNSLKNTDALNAKGQGKRRQTLTKENTNNSSRLGMSSLLPHPRPHPPTTHPADSACTICSPTPTPWAADWACPVHSFPAPSRLGMYSLLLPPPHLLGIRLGMSSPLSPRDSRLGMSSLLSPHTEADWACPVHSLPHQQPSTPASRL